MINMFVKPMGKTEKLAKIRRLKLYFDFIDIYADLNLKQKRDFELI